MNSISVKNSDSASTKAKLAAIILIAIGLLLAMAGAWLVYNTSLFLVITVFIAAIILLIMATFLLKANPNIMIALVGLCITCLSFACQPLGPEIRQYGTECIPIEECFLPVRGGGFPIQYVIDSPGISIPDSLGIEDEFRFWAFVLDIIFYVVSSWLFYKLILYYHSRKSRQHRI